MEARIYLAKEIEQTCITPPLRGNPPMLEVTNYSKTDVLADQNLLIYSRGLTFQNTFLSYSRAPTTDTRKTKIVACWESNYYDVLTVSLKELERLLITRPIQEYIFSHMSGLFLQLVVGCEITFLIASAYVLC